MSDGPPRRQLFGEHLGGVSNCPHCGVANPTLSRLWQSSGLVPRGTVGPRQVWGIYCCTSCGSCVLARGKDNQNAVNAEITEVIPSPKEAHSDIPEPARGFLQQAYQTMHAPDAAVMTAGSAVDAMLKRLGYEESSVYSRINKAVEEHKLNEEMGGWAHEVRLGSNRPRHADNEKPHATAAEAKQSVEFAEALGYFLFVLTKQVERGTTAAKAAAEPKA